MRRRWPGARDICAETIMEDATVRGEARALFLQEGRSGAKLAVEPEQAAEKDPRGVYRLYYDFTEPVARSVPHRTLALNRAEREDVLRVAVEVPFERAEPLIQRPIGQMRARPSPTSWEQNLRQIRPAAIAAYAFSPLSGRRSGASGWSIAIQRGRCQAATRRKSPAGRSP